MLTTHRHLVPRLRMCGAIPLLPLYASIRQGKLYFLMIILLSFEILKKRREINHQKQRHF